MRHAYLLPQIGGRSPYWYTAVALALASIPFLIVKAALFLPRKAWLAPSALIVASVGFSLAHIGSATNVMLWARRRYLLGLSDYEKADPWEASICAFLSAALPLRSPSSIVTSSMLVHTRDLLSQMLIGRSCWAVSRSSQLLSWSMQIHVSYRLEASWCTISWYLRR